MIIRRKVNRHFTTIPNEPIIDDKLSFETLGLLTYLLSRPDNWRVCVEQLKTRGAIGRDKAYRLLTDLMHRGYVIRRQARDNQSKQFGVYEYIVYDEPQKALADDFEKHGARVIERVRIEKPEAYIKVIASLLPKDLNLNLTRYENLTDEQLILRLKIVTEQAAPIIGHLIDHDDVENDKTLLPRRLPPTGRTTAQPDSSR